MDCTSYDRIRFETGSEDPGSEATSPTVRAALVYTAITIVIALGAILLLDRAHIHLPVLDETTTSAGQA